MGKILHKMQKNVEKNNKSKIRLSKKLNKNKLNQLK